MDFMTYLLVLSLSFMYIHGQPSSTHTTGNILGGYEDTCNNGNTFDGEIGFFPHPSDCGQYVVCSRCQLSYVIKTCPPGLHWDSLSEACNFPCLANCTLTHKVCEKSWVEVLKTASNGNTLTGSKAILKAAVEQGSRIKITTDSYSTEMDNCHIRPGQVCCQALPHIAKQSWESFQSASYWWMSSICTTGNWHMIRYYVGGQYATDTHTTSSFTWFVYKSSDLVPIPAYSTFANGTVRAGDKLQLIAEIQDGGSLSIVARHTRVYPIQNVLISRDSSRSRTVSAEHIWSVSQRNVRPNYIEFQDNAYWWFLTMTTSSTRDMSRWSLGSHTSRRHTHDTVPMDWFVDKCWRRVHSHGQQGSASTALRRAVESGHALRVQLDDTFLEVDNIRVSGDHISVQAIASLARASPSTFKSDLNWEFRLLATTGSVRTYRPLVGSTTASSPGSTTSRNAMTWYVDTRTWTLMYHTLANGSVVSGSALSVRHAVEDGADVRIGYELAGESGFRFSRVDNVGLGPSPDIGAQVIRDLRDHPLGNNEFRLDAVPQWSFKLITTKGDVRTTYWDVGAFVNRGRPAVTAELKWFVST